MGDSVARDELTEMYSKRFGGEFGMVEPPTPIPNDLHEHEQIQANAPMEPPPVNNVVYLEKGLAIFTGLAVPLSPQDVDRITRIIALRIVERAEDELVNFKKQHGLLEEGQAVELQKPSD